jgi:CRP-like cAMP-binding protein
MDIDQLVQIYLSDEETYESGEIIIEEGTRVNWIYIILEGQAKVTKRTKAGIVTTDKLKKGAIFGEMALLGTVTAGQSPYVIAADGAVRVGVLDFQQLIRDYDSLSPALRSLITTLIMKLDELNRRIAAFVVAANQEGRAKV